MGDGGRADVGRAERRRGDRTAPGRRWVRMWWLLGAGAVAVAAAVVVIVVVAAAPWESGEDGVDGTVPAPEDAHVIGDPGAPVTMVVFSSFT